MTTVILSLIFLLADGTPAKHAIVSCPQIPTYLSGDDARTTIEDATLLIDSRGATILIMEPGPLTCSARYQGQAWTGTLSITKGRNVIRVYLKESHE